MFQLVLRLPTRADNLITKMEQGRLEVRVPALSREMERMRRSQRKTTLAIIFAAFLISGVQFYLAGEITVGIIFFGIAGLILLVLVLTR